MTTNQFTVRVDSDLIEAYKTRCEQQGYQYTEITRILLRDYAEGRIQVGSMAVQPSLEDALQ